MTFLSLWASSKLQHSLAFEVQLIPLSSANVTSFSLFHLQKSFLCIYLCIILLISTPNPFRMLRTQLKGYFTKYDNTTLSQNQIKKTPTIRLLEGHLSGSGSWTSDSWFWPGLWSQGQGIEPCVRLRTEHGTCLRVSLSLPLFPTCARSLSLSKK